MAKTRGTSTRKSTARLFPALLKHWRGRRGWSQLDLSLSAEISSRHVSFLETGRAQPSREMVLRLGSTLDVSLRDQNAMLQAAGFPEEFDEPGLEAELPDAIGQAIDRMLAKHEPYPMVVMDRLYNVLRTNAGAERLLSQMIADPAAMVAPLNVFRALFDPRLIRPFVMEWERTAHALVARLHRESLANPDDPELMALVRSLFEYPDVPEAWRQPDFTVPNGATLSIRLRRGAVELEFLTTITAFNAPQNVTLEELRIESYFPLNDATAEACERLTELAAS